MPMQFRNLDSATRAFIVSEINMDVRNRNLYLSDRLNAQGQRDYPELLLSAATLHDEVWLTNELQSRGLFNPTFQRRKPSGGFTTVTMPTNAAEMLAEGEFNRFYIRGVCMRAIDNGINRVVVHRAKQVNQPRPESQAKIGSTVDAKVLLDDLRTSIGVDTALGLPSGPNSGLSVHLP